MITAINASAARAVAIVNDVAIAVPCKGIYVGVGGDITLDTIGGDTNVLFKNAVQGSTIAVQAKLVHASGTTATNLVALYQ